MSKKNPKKTKVIEEKSFRKPDTTSRLIDNDRNVINYGRFLYKFVYSSTISVSFVFLLISSFLLQGVHIVKADELVAAEGDSFPAEVATIDEVVPLEPDEIDIDAVLLEVLPDTTLGEVIETPAEEPVFETIDEEPGSTSDQPPLPPIDEIPPEDGGDSDIGEGELPLPPEPVATSSEIGVIVTPPESGTGTGVSTSTETQEVIDVIDTLAATTTATSSEAVLDVPINLTYSDTEFTFNKQECTELASGSFYCLKPQQNMLDDALFSAPDTDGDLEIFLVRNNEQMQITNNLVDDASPYFDPNSNSIVWHKLVNDRYQIISYDIETGIEEQISKGNTNNMEPTRQGLYTVWQRWGGSSWDIVLFDGEKEKLVSESTAHDIAPYIHGSLVVWNRYGATQEKTIEMFDMTSQTYVTVNDPDGLSVTNPRMVFVYDSLHPNGDVVTKGFDMISREFIDLGSMPKPLPDQLPASDSTGETRALIQSKPTVKSEVEELITGSSTAKSGPSPLPPTSLDPLTLDLNNASSTVTMETPIIINTDFDLVIPGLTIEDEPSIDVYKPDIL